MFCLEVSSPGPAAVTGISSANDPCSQVALVAPEPMYALTPPWIRYSRPGRIAAAPNAAAARRSRHGGVFDRQSDDDRTTSQGCLEFLSGRRSRGRPADAALAAERRRPSAADKDQRHIAVLRRARVECLGESTSRRIMSMSRNTCTAPYRARSVSWAASRHGLRSSRADQRIKIRKADVRWGGGTSTDRRLDPAQRSGDLNHLRRPETLHGLAEVTSGSPATPPRSIRPDAPSRFRHDRRVPPVRPLGAVTSVGRTWLVATAPVLVPPDSGQQVWMDIEDSARRPCGMPWRALTHATWSRHGRWSVRSAQPRRRAAWADRTPRRAHIPPWPSDRASEVFQACVGSSCDQDPRPVRSTGHSRRPTRVPCWPCEGFVRSGERPTRRLFRVVRPTGSCMGRMDKLGAEKSWIQRHRPSVD